jgi:hypothetical protein
MAQRLGDAAAVADGACQLARCAARLVSLRDLDPSRVVVTRQSAHACQDRGMSRRDLAHVLTRLWELSGGKAGVGVTVEAVDEAIGRGRGDMRTPLNLQSLEAQGVVGPLPDGSWALTPEGVAQIEQDREL